MGSLYGYEIESDLPLRRLNSAPGRRGVVRVESSRSALDERVGALTAYLETPEGVPVFGGAETADGCLLSFPGSGTFHVVPTELRITVDARGPMEEVEHRLAASALGTLLAVRGDLALHASAVEIGGGTVLFCGPSGRGKSTLAHALARLGAPVLCEDGAIAEMSARVPIAHPGPRGVRLRRRINGSVDVSLVADPGGGEPDPSPIHAVALLEERGPELTIEPLDPVESLLLLTPSLGHTGGTASLARSFGLLGSLLEAVPAFRLILPDDLEALPDTARRLLDTPWARA